MSQTECEWFERKLANNLSPSLIGIKCAGLVSAEAALDILSEKMSKKCDFPHEIGIFLDYPHEDVVGFIRNKGQNYLDCGYWKVYGDVKKCEIGVDIC